MKCYDCGKEMRLLTGYTEDDNGVGLIETDGEYWECTDPACGCQLVPAATVHKVDVIRAERTKKLLWGLVSSPEDLERLFISVKDVAAILGITRQAVEKSLVIKGLTYNIVVMGVRYWLRKSVELYKETGDGRFPLPMPTATDSHSNGWTTRTTKGHKKVATATSPVLTPAD